VRAAYVLQNKGYENLKVLRGGMLAWETENLLEAVDV
jgi:rhodanese-related sulfurtransferase